jgi:hypothetical protein
MNERPQEVFNMAVHNQHNLAYWTLMLLAIYVNENPMSSGGPTGLRAAIEDAIDRLFPEITETLPPDYLIPPTPGDLSIRFDLTNYTIDYSWIEKFEHLFEKYEHEKQVYSMLEDLWDMLRKKDLYSTRIRDNSKPEDVAAARKSITDLLFSGKIERKSRAQREHGLAGS